MADAFAWPDFLSAVGLIAVIGAWDWWMERRRHRRGGVREPVEDEPGSTPYRIFSTACDCTMPARDAPALLAREDAIASIGPPRDTASQAERLAAADRWAETEAAVLAAAAGTLIPLCAREGARLAITLLIDHSGSMRNRMIATAATVRWFSALCDREGVALMVAGFTTLGWRGGEPRRLWIAQGRPGRPGRLCALLHLVDRDFHAPLTVDQWSVMLDPTVLRENIDGEAIGWAASLLRARTEPRRLLIVLADGAPVDNSTLMENGPRFLDRDILRVMGEIDAAGDVTLGAVGMGHSMERYFARWRAAIDPAGLPEALAALVGAMASPDFV